MIKFDNISSNDDLEKLNNSLKDIQEKKCDIDSNINQVKYLPEDRKFILSTLSPIQVMNFNNFAKTQLLTRLTMPKSYIDRCSNDLANTNIQYWLNVFKDKELVFRSFKNDHTEIYAVVSTRFNREFDDINSIPIIYNLIKDIPEIQLTSYNYSPMLSELLITFRDLQIENEPIGGISIVNSEVGLSCLHIRPFLFLKGLPIYSQNKELITSFKHLGNRDISGDIKTLSSVLKESIQLGKLQLSILEQEVIEDIEKEFEVINFVCPNVSKRVLETLKSEWNLSERTTKLQFIEGIIQASNLDSLPLFKQFNIKQEIGGYLQILNKSQLNRLRQIMV